MISLFELQNLANNTLSNENIFFDDVYFDSRHIIKSGNGVFFCLENDEKKRENILIKRLKKNVEFL